MVLRRARSILDLYRCLFAPVALIGVIHIIGGAAVLYAPKAVDVTQLAGIVMLVGRHPMLIALGLIVVGAMAISARVTEISPLARTWLVVPQQAVLLVQLVGVVMAASAGAYPDGYIPVPGDWRASLGFITGDQAALLVLCLSHTIEMFWMKAFPTLAEYERMVARNLTLALELQEARQALALRSQTAMWEDWTEEMKRSA
jgi:hypothetical protein